jgi:hypothetical protein
MELIKDKFYHVIDEYDTRGYVIFQFAGNNYQDKFYQPHYTYSLGCMNRHWDAHYFNRKDGKNTWPFEFNNAVNELIANEKLRYISTESRKIREATIYEISWLKNCIALDMMVTKDEYRELKLEEILG